MSDSSTPCLCVCSRPGGLGLTAHDSTRSLTLEGIAVLCNLSALTNLQSLQLCNNLRPLAQLDALVRRRNTWMRDKGFNHCGGALKRVEPLHVWPDRKSSPS